VRLKKIKLAGFKSFVEPTSIPFPGEMTAIVGPNGCGKSNVIDAVRWVLGESSAKNLRGDAMTDVIFNGSSSRKPVGQCSVELVFDNSAGRIAGEFANYNELSVKRLVTRDAQSTYFLNGTKCRRRDVTDLFLGTGLGPRSYAIIEQGMISRLIESKPQELRVFIEEAAGISKYKERRRETENRIKHTHDNLERLNDVRDELGRQLEKLQRQAAAATRYKTLRAQARELKGQLAAIRFLKNSEHIETLEKQRSALQVEVDDLNARMQGDEAGVEQYRTKQVDTKQLLDDLQQQLFSTSTSITRLEQNALHAKQRKGQLEGELSRLSEQQTLLISSLREAEEALNVSSSALNDIEPELEIKEAELAHAKERFEDAENGLRSFNSHAREQESAYHLLKNNVQQCHSQIQSTMSMQLRTSQRISELHEELKQLDSEDFSTQIAEIEAQAEEAENVVEDNRASLEKESHLAEKNAAALKHLEAKLRETEGQYQTISSTIEALNALQKDDIENNDATLQGVDKLWQHLSTPPQLAKCVESILNHMNQPMVALSHSTHDLLSNLVALPNGNKVFTKPSFTTEARAGSLCEALLPHNTAVPSFFNDVMLCESDQEITRMVAELEKGNIKAGMRGFDSVISLDGLWLGKDWIIKPGALNDGVIQRANKIASLETQRETLFVLQEDIAGQVETAQGELATSEERKTRLQKSLNESESTLLQLKNKLSLVVMQYEQQSERTQKLQSELDKQQALLSKEEEQLAQLSEKLELEEAQILEHEAHIDEVNNKREQNERFVSELRSVVETLTSQNHELALKRQQLENHRNLYEQQVTRNNQQHEEYAATEARLQHELTQLLSPQDKQNAELQMLLASKEELEQRKHEQQIVLEDIEQWLREAEKGHQALNKDIQARQTNIDKLSIDIEGYRVRANTILEQLDDTQQSLKTLLETLPENADEVQWQENLEKTQLGLQRLGAVNLAAVEEFETQSERKTHLDTQHSDLTQALDTLQSAIRKIDKETRTRFSSTFEQVNEDLKNLFPKVFGGGSAYLALTDDDLLETGVTIMARPPGKKNSTIHLLSGGEKALTALSLVFAIFRLNPAPFCLLDEVDAPLDDANVGRFCNLVSEMSQTVQFIYITHNKIAMEMASHLTGVTMAEPGVSRMVAVDVDEAVAFAEA
jgi:chromosome segregation protein